MKTIEDIIDNSLCIGCGLCEALVPELKMAVNNKGFLVPQGDFSSIKDEDNETIIKICPGVNQHNEIPAKTKNERLWGKVLQSKFGCSSDMQVRFKGSSGGVLSAIAIYLLEHRMITCVLQIGVDKEDPIRNVARTTHTRTEIINSAGSRYAPASLLTSLVKALEQGEKVLIIGKPCDIAGVRNFLRKYPIYSPQVPYLFSFFCAGQPSYLATDKLLNRIGCNSEDVKEFHYRGEGWPGYATAITHSNRRHSCSYEESWGEILGRQIHFRCKICPDGIGIFADIVCGDYWHVKNGEPDFTESDGRSLILARTARGEQLLNLMIKEGAIKAEDFEVKNLELIQKYQANRRIVIGARILAFTIAKRIKLNFRGFGFLSNLFFSKSKTVLSNFYGTFKRANKI